MIEKEQVKTPRSGKMADKTDSGGQIGTVHSKDIGLGLDRLWSAFDLSDL